jgi:hypothetical protein
MKKIELFDILNLISPRNRKCGAETTLALKSIFHDGDYLIVARCVDCCARDIMDYCEKNSSL